MGAKYNDLKKLQSNIEKLKKEQEQFLESCVKELAARLLRSVIKNTAPGQYPKKSGKKGGTLRRGWTSETHEEAASRTDNGDLTAAFLNSLEIKHSGNSYIIEIKNPVEYAPYVEYGHRTRGGKGFVPGKRMLTLAESELRRNSRAILEKKLKKWLGGVL